MPIALTTYKIKEAIGVYLSMAGSRMGIAHMGLIAFVEAPHIQRIRSQLPGAFEENRRQFRALLGEGVAKGEIRPTGCAVAARLVIGMALEAIEIATLTEDRIKPDATADEIPRVLFDGIGS